MAGPSINQNSFDFINGQWVIGFDSSHQLFILLQFHPYFTSLFNQLKFFLVEIVFISLCGAEAASWFFFVESMKLMKQRKATSAAARPRQPNEINYRSD